MAPSSGHTLIPKFMNAVRYATAKAAQALRSRFPLDQHQAGNAATTQLVSIPIRNATRHPIHPIAALQRSRCGQTRSFVTSVRAALQETYPSLRSIARNAPSRAAILARAPTAPTFGSALRPRLTGGTLQRTAGGYVALGGRRAFSHVPSAQSHVLSNVSAAVRAFWLSGQRAQFDGTDKVTGEKRFVAVGQHTESVTRTTLKHRENSELRGTSLDFCVIPELNSLRSKKRQRRSQYTQEKAELTSVVSSMASDFAKNLGIMAAVHRDLKLLSKLGDLPVSESRPGWITVRFAGCDGRTVERLCDELGIARGIVREDEAWAEDQAQDVKMALLFPAAPSEGVTSEYDAVDCFYERPIMSSRSVVSEDLDDFIESDGKSKADETLSPLESLSGSGGHVHRYAHVDRPTSVLSWQPNPWAGNVDADVDLSHVATGQTPHPGRPQSGFQGVSSATMEMQNIYNFIAECDERLGTHAFAR